MPLDAATANRAAIGLAAEVTGAALRRDERHFVLTLRGPDECLAATWILRCSPVLAALPSARQCAAVASSAVRLASSKADAAISSHLAAC